VGFEVCKVWVFCLWCGWGTNGGTLELESDVSYLRLQPGLSQLRLYLLRTSSFSSGDFFVAAQGRLDVFKEATRWVSSWLGAAPQEEEEEEEEEEKDDGIQLGRQNSFL
jgi:hypothetical protein